jgi:hypothetical protein
VTPAPDALTGLVVALDDFARALETGDAAAVLAAEETLAAAVSALRSANLAPIAQSPSVRARIDDVRLAIGRCKALGYAASDLAAIMAPPGYSPKGLRLPSVAHATTVAART